MTEDEHSKLELVLNAIEEQGEDANISKWERDFMADMQARYAEWGERTRISPKQMNIIDRIYDKVIPTC